MKVKDLEGNWKRWRGGTEKRRIGRGRKETSGWSPKCRPAGYEDGLQLQRHRQTGLRAHAQPQAGGECLSRRGDLSVDRSTGLTGSGYSYQFDVTSDKNWIL